MNSRFVSRDRPFGSSYNGSSRPNYASRDSQGFRSPGRATREGAALPGWEEAAAAAGFEEDDGFGGAGEAASSSSTLSCFVEVKFRGKAQRTAAVDSDMPMWNEQVSAVWCSGNIEDSYTLLAIESTGRQYAGCYRIIVCTLEQLYFFERLLRLLLRVAASRYVYLCAQLLSLKIGLGQDASPTSLKKSDGLNMSPCQSSLTHPAAAVAAAPGCRAIVPSCSCCSL
jgi:hypothetical protein